MGVEITLPKISIVTPSYNQGKYLEKTILSVIEQGYPNLEYIIIDGGSTDESVEIIRKYEKHLTYWVSEPDRGQSHAINKGFARATGEIFGWLNSDDWYHPGALKTVAETFAANPEAGAVVGAGEMVDEDGTRVLYKEPFDVDVHSLSKWPEEFFWQPSCFFTREAWEKSGPLKEELHFAMDLDLWISIARSFRFTRTCEMLSFSLKHEDAKTAAQDYLSMIEAAFVVAEHGGGGEAKHTLGRYVGYLKSREKDLLWQIESRDEQLRYKDRLLIEKDNFLSEKDSIIAGKDSIIAGKDNQLADMAMRMECLLNSLSWKSTIPLRWIHHNTVALSQKIKIEFMRITNYGKKNIVIQLDAFDKGGLEEVVYNLTKNIIDDNRYNVYVFVTSNKLGYLGNQLKNEGVNVVLLNNDTNMLMAMIRRLNIKLVNLHYSVFGAQEYAANNVPMIYTVHNSYIWADKEFVKQRSAAYGKIQKFIAVSDQAKDFFVERFQIDRDKAVTIPNGLDLKSLTAVETTNREEYSLSSDDFVFINVSSINWNKFHVLMISAMQRLVKEYCNFKMLFVGNVHDKDCYNYIIREIQQKKLSSHIQLIDFVPKGKVLGLMNMSDCFVLPSLIEGWSIAVMEAMYSELPLILSDVGSARNVIINNDIGMIIPQPYKNISELTPSATWNYYIKEENITNLDDLCNSMVNIYTNSKEWKQKALKGKQKILDVFNSEAMTKQYLSLFESML